MKTAKVRPAFLLLCLLLTIAGVGAGHTESVEDPVYNGRPLSAWVDELLQFQSLYKVAQTNRPAVQAVRSIGTNAIPWLLRELTITDPKGNENPAKDESDNLHQNRGLRGFWALGEIGSPAIPSLVKLVCQQPAYAPSALAGIGVPALPALENLLTNAPPGLTPERSHFNIPASTLGGLFVAIVAGRIPTNQAAYLLPTVRLWTQCPDRHAVWSARGVCEQLSPGAHSHE